VIVVERVGSDAGRLLAGAVLAIVAAACSNGIVTYESTDEVRSVLAEAEIGCRDFQLEDPPAAGAVACSFTDWTPGTGLVASTVVIYGDPGDAADFAARCRSESVRGGQLLYRDGQNWLVSIEAYAEDRRTASNITDQAFVTRVGELLRTGVVDC
jgi:hypothetical protein